MTTTLTPVTDLCDAHEDKLAFGTLRVLAPVFRSFGKRAAFAGPAVTLKVFEDNGLVRSTLEGQGAGRVLVIDGGGSLRCALVGGNLGQLAKDNGWEGILINGCVRDTRELAECDIGIHALGWLSPVASLIEVQTDPNIISPRATIDSLRAQSRG